jgi:ribonuclease D
MHLITQTDELETLCRDLADMPYITIDTEFLRDKTYYPKLCLIQVSAEGKEEVAIDTLADGIDLEPLFTLMRNENVVKVFHACRQDLEIFYHAMGELPTNVFDTQVAAMVCGYGDQIGYHNLVSDVCGTRIDKGPQFTDWSRRPLSNRQLRYALDDVVYLKQVYKTLKNKLEERGRDSWVNQEMNYLLDPETYKNAPDDAWQRVKIKSNKAETHVVLRAVAKWREEEAQRRDVPRNRIVRDETIADLSIHPPKEIDGLRKIRNIPGDIAKGKRGEVLFKIVQEALKSDFDKSIVPPAVERFPENAKPVLEMLKVLLRIVSSDSGVAAKLIANKTDLEKLAVSDDPDILTLKGWRYDVFGQDALALKQGKIFLGLKNGKIVKQAL